jgi:5-methylcytosine-specific restriction endonuclease McrBC GTP-binding regulatory subunit McrB
MFPASKRARIGSIGCGGCDAGTVIRSSKISIEAGSGGGVRGKSGLILLVGRSFGSGVNVTDDFLRDVSPEEKERRRLAYQEAKRAAAEIRKEFLLEQLQHALIVRDKPFEQQIRQQLQEIDTPNESST